MSKPTRQERIENLAEQMQELLVEQTDMSLLEKIDTTTVVLSSLIIGIRKEARKSVMDGAIKLIKTIAKKMEEEE